MAFLNQVSTNIDSQLQVFNLMLSRITEGYTWKDFEDSNTIDFIIKCAADGRRERDELKEHYRLMWTRVEELHCGYLRRQPKYIESYPAKKAKCLDLEKLENEKPTKGNNFAEKLIAGIKRDLKNRLMCLSFDIENYGERYLEDMKILEDIVNDGYLNIARFHTVLDEVCDFFQAGIDEKSFKNPKIPFITYFKFYFNRWMYYWDKNQKRCEKSAIAETSRFTPR
jgi:hypothetical protein